MAQTILATAASSWAVLMGIAPALQIRRMLRAQSSREVSVAYFMVLLIGFLLWIAYGVAGGILALVIPNTVALLMGTTVVIVALRLRNRSSGRYRHRRTRTEAREPGAPGSGCSSSCSQGAGENGDSVVGTGLGEDGFEMVLDRVFGQ
jgi:uncharacterized protein with PQ loop repeat